MEKQRRTTENVFHNLLATKKLAARLAAMIAVYELPPIHPSAAAPAGHSHSTAGHCGECTPPSSTSGEVASLSYLVSAWWGPAPRRLSVTACNEIRREHFNREDMKWIQHLSFGSETAAFKLHTAQVERAGCKRRSIAATNWNPDVQYSAHFGGSGERS